MHGAAGLAGAGIERLFPRLQARKGGKDGKDGAVTAAPDRASYG